MRELIFLEALKREYIWGYEYWVISAHSSADCRVTEGVLEGETLSSLWSNHRELFGDAASEVFPLLTKIIDAHDDLSIQVHPDDTYAAAHEHGALGKSECWYVLDCKADSTIVIGHHAKDKLELEQMIKDHDWNTFLREIPIKKGDFFQIDAGCLHAIKGGTVILETQQNSDITYRVYDYDRLKDGQARQLHVQQSIDCIKAPFLPHKDEIITEKLQSLTDDKTIVGIKTHLVTTALYTVERYDIDGEVCIDFNHNYTLVSVISGSGYIDEHSVNGSASIDDASQVNSFIVPSGYGKCRISGKLSMVVSYA